ncbi:hypothetical protein R3W88_023992 [Solanum pinnatisectum]|uniref:KIB1-4 beta-propeller domain-containing protein n=1 Tax=Solanum pinnatisectum TaxID=50273 RepID=A0AAV9LZ51_9SOLN|nr:hypothetical protein R3W88_023992 [Solanum pinnatisectum]
MADWAGLTNDRLVEIAKRVKVIEDFIIFDCVCNSWRTASIKDNFDMIIENFYSLSKGKILRRLYLPEAKGRDCFPSDKMGWFFTQSLEVGEEVLLLNPFSVTKIQLPNQFVLIEDLDRGVHNWIGSGFSNIKPNHLCKKFKFINQTKLIKFRFFRVFQPWVTSGFSNTKSNHCVEFLNL